MDGVKIVQYTGVVNLPDSQLTRGAYRQVVFHKHPKEVYRGTHLHNQAVESFGLVLAEPCLLRGRKLSTDLWLREGAHRHLHI